MTKFVSEIQKLVRMLLIYREVYAILEPEPNPVTRFLYLPQTGLNDTIQNFSADSQKGFDPFIRAHLECLTREFSKLTSPDNVPLAQHWRGEIKAVTAFLYWNRNSNVHGYIMNTGKERRLWLFEFFLNGE